MATLEEYVAAAKVPPSKRTVEQATLVARGQNIQEVRNADYASQQAEQRGR